MANDTGGAIAQIFAARHPHRLATFTLTNCDTSDNVPPEVFKPIVELAAAGQLAPTAVAMLGDLGAAGRLAFGSGYEHLDRVDPAVIRSYLEPWCGTLERARHFERLLTALDAADLTSVTPLLAGLTVPTLVVWGHRGRLLRRLLGLLAAEDDSRHDPRGHRRRPAGVAVLPWTSGPWTWCRTWSSTGPRPPRSGRQDIFFFIYIKKNFFFFFLKKKKIFWGGGGGAPRYGICWVPPVSRGRRRFFFFFF